MGWKHRGTTIRFGPGDDLLISKNNNSTLSLDRVVELIFLDGKCTHGRDGHDALFLAKGVTLSSSDNLTSVVIIQALLLFFVGIQPNAPVRIVMKESVLKERGSRLGE